MKTKKQIYTKLNDLGLIKGQLNKELKDKETDSTKEQLTAVNNQIMILHWVLKDE